MKGVRPRDGFSFERNEAEHLPRLGAKAHRNRNYRKSRGFDVQGMRANTGPIGRATVSREGR